MTARRLLLVGVAAAGLAVAGAGMTSALMDLPQDAVPVQDPVGDLMRNTNRAPAAPTTSTSPAAQPASAPTAPAVVPTPVPGAPAAPLGAEVAAVQEEAPTEAEAEAKPEAAKPVAATVATPGRRQRRPIAIVHAIDKVTAESMLFEVEIGGRPVRFNKTLIFSARACEVSASDEQTEDAIAYLEVGVQPRGIAVPTEARQIFKGWMFASSPAISGLQHPIYDAWVVGCKA
ncbi:DUF2155 domain-containing protein [Brevundimonas sp. NPDC090276]|uniref:DUF2155 domain-containing protein n=1 Tax=Brevundimonas sp. NPDC090276 TaxID=3363956 RepID=UPI00383A16A4